MTFLAAITLKLSIVMTTALVAVLALRRRSAALRHWVLTVALLAGTALPLLVLVLPAWHISVAGLPPELNDATTPAASEVSPTIILQDAIDPRRPAAIGRPATHAAPTSTATTWLRALWIAGALLGASALCVGIARLKGVASAARRIDSGRWVELAREIARSIGVGRPVALLQSDSPSLLVTWGFVRPTIMLPAGAAAWSEERAGIVLRHELEHIRRGDWLVQLVGELLCVAQWFNPAVWIVCRRLRRESEQACDDAVLRSGVDATDYAAHLLELARVLNAGRRIRLPAPAMARSSSLEGRISAMLNERLNRTPLRRWVRIATASLLVGFTASVASVAAQRFSTFSGTLVDQTNAVLPNVAVTLANPATLTRHEVRTDPTGHFQLAGLSEGEYELVIEEPGFAPFSETITIAGRDISRAIQLQLGDLHETIMITSGGAKATASDPVLRQAARDYAAARSLKVAERCAGGGPADGNIGGNIMQPTKVADVKPRYPENLQAAQIGGVVTLEALIGTDGTVRDVRLVSGDPELGSAAVEAIRQWEFSPTYLNCTPVEVRMGVTATFVTR